MYICLLKGSHRSERLIGVSFAHLRHRGLSRGCRRGSCRGGLSLRRGGRSLFFLIWVDELVRLCRLCRLGEEEGGLRHTRILAVGGKCHDLLQALRALGASATGYGRRRRKGLNQATSVYGLDLLVNAALSY
jgi:hypothetical protein